MPYVRRPSSLKKKLQGFGKPFDYIKQAPTISIVTQESYTNDWLVAHERSNDLSNFFEHRSPT